MQIEQNAPLSGRQEMFLAAPLERVWNLQTDINNWSRWQPDVSAAQLEGALEVGTIFKWKASGLVVQQHEIAGLSTGFLRFRAEAPLGSFIMSLH
jgi:Polyketide cyclase / dehydrase and lipid transport